MIIQWINALYVSWLPYRHQVHLHGIVITTATTGTLSVIRLKFEWGRHKVKGAYDAPSLPHSIVIKSGSSQGKGGI